MDSETTSYAPAGCSLLCSRVQQVIPAAPESGLRALRWCRPAPPLPDIYRVVSRDPKPTFPYTPTDLLRSGWRESIARIEQMLSEQIGHTNRLRVREQRHRGQLLATRRSWGSPWLITALPGQPTSETRVGLRADLVCFRSRSGPSTRPELADLDGLGFLPRVPQVVVHLLPQPALRAAAEAQRESRASRRSGP
jgi:hypothetical protein